MEGFSDTLLFVIHIIVGFVLVYYAIRAYKRTKYFPMALLAIGFTLLVFGETISENILPSLEGSTYGTFIDEGFEIAGFLILIWAVKKS